jgi:hypothetical protein
MRDKKAEECRRVFEITRYIMRHSGPDKERRAHPTKRNVLLSDLEKALCAVQSRGMLQGIKPYHFINVTGMWNNDGESNLELGRELVDEVIQNGINKKGNLIYVIRDMSKDTFFEKLEFRKIGGRIIRYNASSMFYNLKFDLKRKGSPYAATKYWIDTHPDERIRKEYGRLRPWHLLRVSRDLWVGDEGRENGRELIDDLITTLAARYGGIAGALRNLTAETFEKEKLEFRTSDGSFYYDANSMFQRVRFDGRQIRSLHAAVSYWMDASPDRTLKERYAEELKIIKTRSERKWMKASSMASQAYDN